MSSKRTATKRKTSDATTMEPVKKAKGASKSDSLFADVKDEYQSQYVDRRFYPPQMSISGAQEYIQDRKPRPIDLLDKAVAETAKQRAAIKVNKSVIHWYKCDLRTLDNASLAKASAKAHESKVPLICMYLYSAQDFQAHMISPARIDFILRTLEILQKDLAKLDIPLYVEKVEKRKNMTSRVIALAKEWSANHVYCNLEYEVDELRREARLVTDCLSEGIAFNPYHDTCVVDPNTLTGKTSGKPYAVYSPWFRAWIAHVQQNQKLLDPRPSPSKNPASARKAYAQLFDISMPGAQEDKKLSAEEKKRMESMWPAGEHAAHERLERFVEERVTKYSETRNFPALKSTSSLSVHFSSGTLAARTAIRTARDANTTKKLDGGDEGVRVPARHRRSFPFNLPSDEGRAVNSMLAKEAAWARRRRFGTRDDADGSLPRFARSETKPILATRWISEVAWRDFYKHVMVHWPHMNMNVPFKPEYTKIEWEWNDEHLKAWKEGKTGYPIVDAAMRQMNHCKYMHNRPRMIVASLLAKHLLLDWRLGERYFMETLIDGDSASNTGGWGFGSSTGVDPQPYFRIFAPITQGQKFDPEGEYIREWVPELRGLGVPAVHEPYAKLGRKEFEKLGYPAPIVEHKMARERALARYKGGLAKE